VLALSAKAWRSSTFFGEALVPAPVNASESHLTSLKPTSIPSAL
jgi:hypothetical protein